MESGDTKVKRSYDSSGRQAAAIRRRECVVAVAIQLFATHGWTGTTLAMVAKEAGVSTELVSGAFGGKPGLLLAAARSSTFAPGETLTEAVASIHLADVDGVDARMAAAVSFAVKSLRAMAPLMPAMIHAANEDEQALALIQEGRTRRSQMSRDMVRLLQRSEGEPDPNAVDLVYLVTSGEVYLQLVLELGWSEERFAAWLRDELERIVNA